MRALSVSNSVIMFKLIKLLDNRLCYKPTLTVSWLLLLRRRLCVYLVFGLLLVGQHNARIFHHCANETNTVEPG